MTIDQETVEAFERDGVVCVRSVVAADWTTPLLAESLAMMGEERRSYTDTLSQPTRMGDGPTVEDDPGRNSGGVYFTETRSLFRRFVLQSPFAEDAGALMRRHVVRFFYDQLFVKEPGTLSPTQWHHDMPFWPLAGEHLISCWVALTPVTMESSGLEYVAGSHVGMPSTSRPWTSSRTEPSSPRRTSPTPPIGSGSSS